MSGESRVLVLSIIGAAAFTPALATIYVPEPITYYYDAAETVARVYVIGGDLLQGEFEGAPYACGQRVTAEVVESFKGEGELVEFVMEGMVLQMGEEYLLFIEPAGSKRGDKLVSTNSFHAREELRRREACRDIVKTHTASWLSTARFLRRFDRDSHEMEPWLWPAYNIQIPEDAGIRFQSVKVHAVDVDGEVVTNDGWGWNHGVVMPDSLWMYEGAFEWESFRDYLLSETGHAEGQE